MLKCEMQITGSEHAAEVERLEKIVLDQQKPQKFDPYGENVLSTSEAEFAEICSTMEDNGTFQAKCLTEYDFYSRISFLRKKFKEK